MLSVSLPHTEHNTWAMPVHVPNLVPWGLCGLSRHQPCVCQVLQHHARTHTPSQVYVCNAKQRAMQHPLQSIASVQLMLQPVSTKLWYQPTDCGAGKARKKDCQLCQCHQVKQAPHSCPCWARRGALCRVRCLSGGASGALQTALQAAAAQQSGQMAEGGAQVTTGRGVLQYGAVGVLLAAGQAPDNTRHDDLGPLAASTQQVNQPLRCAECSTSALTRPC